MVDIVREIPGSAALDDALTSARLNARRGDASQADASARAPGSTALTNATSGVGGRAHIGVSGGPASRGAEPFDKRRVAQVTELISQHASASRASAGAQWLSTLHASASVALTSLSRWRDDDPVSQAQARRSLDALGALWQDRERGSLGTVDDRLHFDVQRNAPRRFTVDGVAPAQWRASKAQQVSLFPAGPYKPGVEIDLANAVSEAGLRRRTTRALAAYGITLEPSPSPSQRPPDSGWVLSAPGAAWPSLASRFAIAQSNEGVDAHPQRATLRDAPDAIAPRTWRLDSQDTVAQARRALASMVGAIRASHALAKHTARASAQVVGKSQLAGERAADGVAFEIALASAKAWTSRLGKQPPFVALTLAMPKGVPVSRANVRALLGDV